MDNSSYERYLSLLDFHGATSASVSKATGIPQSTFSDWKKGKSVPKLEKMAKIAQHFDVSVEWLAYGKESNNADPAFSMKDKHEKNIIAMYRNAGNLSEEEASEFEDMFASTLDIYLKAKGIKKK